jgi:anti-anti-sigma regulatory factor
LTARIDIARSAEGACVRVAGRLDAATTGELLEVCHLQSGVLLIDLEELLSLDQASVDALRDLRSAGARIMGASPYITLLLNGGPGDPGPATDSEEKEGE